MWIPSSIVDHDRPLTMMAVEGLSKLQEKHPQVIIVPAHDATVHDTIQAYFPQFAK
jgi:hypothetical protein